MSLSRLMAGRKRDSPVWEYFTYDEQSGKSKCVVCDEKAGNECGVLFAGKNSSNLITHLSRFHKTAHMEYVNKSNASTSEKRGVKRKGDADSTHPPSAKQQSLENCLQRKVVTWATDSQEHVKRVDSVLSMLVSTGCPVTLVDKSCFRTMIRTLDSKFALPGLCKLKIFGIFRRTMYMSVNLM